MVKLLKAPAGMTYNSYSWRGRVVPITMGTAKGWPTKLAGPKPSLDAVYTAASMLSQTGTARHAALAMYLRDEGATQPQVIIGTGDTGVNAYTQARDTGALAVRTVNSGVTGHKSYALELPAKGKPATAKAEGKLTTAKGKPAKPAAKPAKPADKPATAAKAVDTGNSDNA